MSYFGQQGVDKWNSTLLGRACGCILLSCIDPDHLIPSDYQQYKHQAMKILKQDGYIDEHDQLTEKGRRFLNL